MEYKRAIDKPLVPIIKRLNQEGLTTLYSCSGHKYPDRAYISFKDLLTETQKNKAEELMDNLGLSGTGYTWIKRYKEDPRTGHQRMTTAFFTLAK